MRSLRECIRGCDALRCRIDAPAEGKCRCAHTRRKEAAGGPGAHEGNLSAAVLLLTPLRHREKVCVVGAQTCGGAHQTGKPALVGCFFENLQPVGMGAA